jgi:hypothetical protein
MRNRHGTASCNTSSNECTVYPRHVVSNRVLRHEARRKRTHPRVVDMTTATGLRARAHFAQGNVPTTNDQTAARSCLERCRDATSGKRVAEARLLLRPRPESETLPHLSQPQLFVCTVAENTTTPTILPPKLSLAGCNVTLCCELDSPVLATLEWRLGMRPALAWACHAILVYGSINHLAKC